MLTDKEMDAMRWQRSGSGWICCPDFYEYEGWFFEIHSYFGPWPLRKRDFELRRKAGKRFFEMAGRFAALPKNEQIKHRV